MHKLFAINWATLNQVNLIALPSMEIYLHQSINHSGAIPLSDAYFGEGSGVIHYDYVLCSRIKYDLTDCETTNDTRLTGHSEDVGVICQPGED